MCAASDVVDEGAIQVGGVWTADKELSKVGGDFWKGRGVDGWCVTGEWSADAVAGRLSESSLEGQPGSCAEVGSTGCIETGGGGLV